MRAWLQRASGFSMVEAITVLAVMSIAAAVTLPQMLSQRDSKFDSQAVNTLDSAWESAQDYYVGQRGLGENAGPVNSYTGFDAASALKLAQDIPWQGNTPPSDWNQNASFNNFAPSDQWGKAVFIMEVSDQSLGLCAVSRSLAFCRYDDGKYSGTGGKRLGSRYGVSACSTGVALQAAMQRSTDATVSWITAQSAQRSEAACSP